VEHLGAAGAGVGPGELGFWVGAAFVGALCGLAAGFGRVGVLAGVLCGAGLLTGAANRSASSTACQAGSA